MSNKFENFPAEEFIKICFADDVKNFWNKFYDWQQGESFYTSDIDPDQKSKMLYDAHQRLWNKQRNISEVHIIRNGNAYQLDGMINDKRLSLGSDSIMSIYWHWFHRNYPYKPMPEAMKDMIGDIIDRVEYKEIEEQYIVKKEERKCNEKFGDWQKFIWCYLQKANTIGGFILFPRHRNSINQFRGSKPISDRFDLTLECIKRYYDKNNQENPLYKVLQKDEEFFKMLGRKENGFKNYVDFFLLNPWVEEDEKHNYHVKNLLHNNEKENEERNVKTLDNWDFSQEPLPQDSDEWWIFYRNIMNRLDARNQQIAEFLSNSSAQD